MNFKKLHANAYAASAPTRLRPRVWCDRAPIGAFEDIGSLALTGLHRRDTDRNGGLDGAKSASSSVTLVGDVDDVNAGGHPHSLSAVPRKRRIVSMNLATEIGFDR